MKSVNTVCKYFMPQRNKSSRPLVWITFLCVQLTLEYQSGTAFGINFVQQRSLLGGEQYQSTVCCTLTITKKPLKFSMGLCRQLRKPGFQLWGKHCLTVKVISKLALFLYCLDSFLHLKPMHKIHKMRGLRGGHDVGLKMFKQIYRMSNSSQEKESLTKQIEFHVKCSSSQPPD